ncbi:hypothetical protein HGH92_08480 [Chitinophaga varians]|uniref:Uncharacterized protein n=1 Tax=Chitinophaga varians TaxID=2202339 RepID=A0A847RB96_9BACT|nr:hypothetical protein [Chitinophaga varians]NLR64339.1 hypothetical protein [Chitinophaga varians]
MTDTPDHIKQLQLKIWLSKPPMERLKQMMEDNTALNAFWTAAKEQQNNLSTRNRQQGQELL